MTCRNVTITSQTRHFEFEAAILNPKPAVMQLIMTSPRNIWFCSKKHSQNKYTKVKNYLLLTSEGGKPEKRQKIVKIHFWENGCYENVNHHRHVIDTGKFSLINFRKSHEIWHRPGRIGLIKAFTCSINFRVKHNISANVRCLVHTWTSSVILVTINIWHWSFLPKALDRKRPLFNVSSRGRLREPVLVATSSSCDHFSEFSRWSLTRACI